MPPNATVNVAAASNRELQIRRDPPLTFNRLFVLVSDGQSVSVQQNTTQRFCEETFMTHV